MEILSHFVSPYQLAQSIHSHNGKQTEAHMLCSEVHTKGPLPWRHTIEQWVPRGFSFDQDTSQQGHQEQDYGSSPHNCPGTAMTRTGRWSLININTRVHGISWLVNAFSPSAVSAYSPGTVAFMKFVYRTWAPLGHPVTFRDQDQSYQVLTLWSSRPPGRMTCLSALYHCPSAIVHLLLQTLCLMSDRPNH